MKSIITKQDISIAGGKTQTPVAQWALSGLALAMLLASLGVSIPNVALPTLAQSFTASFQAVQWVIISYLLAVTIMIVGVGRLGDIVGHRRVLLAGIGLFTVASFLCGIAPTLWMLIVARVGQGLGAAILLALTVALIRETVPKERTGSAMGLLGTMSAIGTALGPALGGFLIAGPGWRAIFLILVPLGILNFFLVHRYLQIHRPSGKINRSDFDSLGTLLLGLTLAAYALAVTVGNSHFNRFNVVLWLATVLGGSLFVLAEAKVASPLIPLAAFRNTVLSTSLVMNALVATVMMTTLVVGPFYLALALGLNEAGVGLVMSVGPIISTLSGVPAGRMVDRWGASFVIIVGLIEMAVGTFALSMLPAMFGMGGYIAAIIVLTPGYQLFQAANNTTVMMDVNTDQRGVISGMLNLSRNLGLLTGASVMGAVFAFTLGTMDITTAHPEVVANGVQITFAIASGLIVVAAVISMGSRALSTRP